MGEESPLRRRVLRGPARRSPLCLTQPAGITIDDVDVLFDGRLVLDGLRVHAAPGEVVAVTGPPGFGQVDRGRARVPA